MEDSDFEKYDRKRNKQCKVWESKLLSFKKL